MAKAPAIARIGLGLAALGRPAYIDLGRAEDFPSGRSVEAMERRAHAMLDAAHSAGIRWFDAARSYGRAEAFLRSWLDARAIAPGAVTISSKWGYRYVGDWRLVAERHEVKDHSAAALRVQLAESREVLGPHLAVHQIHSASLETGVLDDGEVLDVLAALRDGGVRVGLSASGPGQAETVRRALGIRRAGAPLFSAVQATWNLLERACEGALAEAHASGLTVLVKEALANGRLGPRGDAGMAGPLADLARSAGVGPDAAALAAVLARPWADVVLLGAVSEPQLRSNLRAIDLALPPDAEARLASLREEPSAYWARRAALPWS